MQDLEIKEVVQIRHAAVAEGTGTCGSLCGCTENAEGLAIAFGYAPDDLAALPEGANLGLSCGNPQPWPTSSPARSCSTSARARASTP